MLPFGMADYPQEGFDIFGHYSSQVSVMFPTTSISATAIATLVACAACAPAKEVADSRPPTASAVVTDDSSAQSLADGKQVFRDETFGDERFWTDTLHLNDVIEKTVDPTTALKVIAEVGPDMSRFKSAKHFASWLGLCPGTKISGGKVLSGASKRTTNRAAQSLRLAAAALHKRRLAARLDRAKTITRRFLQTSSSYLHHVNQGCGYKGQEYHEERYSQHVMPPSQAR